MNLFVRCRRAIVLLVAIVVLAPAPAGLTATPEEPSPAVAARAFERYKALAGVWRAESTKGWSEDVTIEVIANGSVVMSTTTFEDAPEAKMVTLYSLDGPSLVATHYCESRTQPHLVATAIDADATTVHFTFAGGGNLASRDRGHMDQALFRFTGDDEFSSQWTWYQDGADDWMEEIHYRRIR